MKKIKTPVNLLIALVLLLGLSASAFADGASAPEDVTTDTSACARGLAAIRAVGVDSWFVLPKEESYLSEWKTLYARKAFKAPCLAVEAAPKLLTGRPNPPYLYEGVEVTVVAEENDMSCMIYRGNNNKQYVGWIRSIRLLDDFPGKLYTVGSEPSSSPTYRDGITVSWGELRDFFQGHWADSTLLSEKVSGCIGFTLEYQLIAENTKNWDSILGPRKIYVRSDGNWIEVGQFPYPEFGAVKVQVWLDEPMDIDAVRTMAQCSKPDIFYYRQTVTDIAVS